MSNRSDNDGSKKYCAHSDDCESSVARIRDHPAKAVVLRRVNNMLPIAIFGVENSIPVEVLSLRAFVQFADLAI